MIHNHSVIYNNNNNLLRNLLKYHLKVSLRSAITPEEQRVLFNLLTRFIRTIRLLLKISINTFSKTFKLIFVQKSVISTFLFAYIYEVVPKLISRFFRRLFNLDFKNFGNEVARILQAPLSPERLPIFMTKLVATLNAFTPIYASILEPHVSPSQIPFMSSLLAAFTSSMLNFPSFQNKKLLKNDRYYTLDWTLILVTRAVDTIITSNFSNVFKTSTRSANMAGRFGDVFMFILSCFFIMDNWFYNPDKLTPDYRNWISQSGQIDEDVLVGLRKFKDGEMEYMSGYDRHFMDYCVKHGRDPRMGDVSKMEKLPCEIFHQFKCKSCVLHALLRFWMQFKLAFKLYFTINFFFYVFVKKFRGNPLKLLLVKTIRSASFLGCFSGIHWLMFCFVRNNHPKLFSQRFWDVLAPRVGSAVCGSSILVEYPDRRNELSMFVTPKALGTFVDPEPTERNVKLEVLCFSASFAVLIAYARSNPSKLRGLLGKGLSYMVKN